ncbi:hypothetical protein G6F32_014549 [Rhizopus arrhizus]|nr:hypothetical protein G6F32_014549 [Rhizopus arrhizus]
MVRVAFDMEDARLGVLGAIAEAVHQDAAGHRTVGTGVAGLGRAGQLVLPDLRERDAGREAHQCQAGAHQGCPGDLQELAATHRGHAVLLGWRGGTQTTRRAVGTARL